MEKQEPDSKSRIYKYKEGAKNEFEGASGDPSIEEISDHIEKHIGEVHTVFHEIISEQVHIDVHWVKPTKERPFHTLVTSGMSDKPMHTPADIEDCDYAELSICLPADWKISEEDFEDGRNYWPIYWLKYLARFPHQYNTWLGYGHTIPNGDPAMPLANDTKLNGLVLLPTTVFDQAFHTLELEKKSIDFYTIIPLYQEEMDMKLEKGVESLFDGFDKYGVNDILDVKRRNVAKRKKLFGLF